MGAASEHRGNAVIRKQADAVCDGAKERTDRSFVLYRKAWESEWTKDEPMCRRITPPPCLASVRWNTFATVAWYESRDHDGNALHTEATRVSFHVDGLDPETAAVLFALIRSRETAEESQIRVATPHEVAVDEDEEQVVEGRRMAR